MSNRSRRLVPTPWGGPPGTKARTWVATSKRYPYGSVKRGWARVQEWADGTVPSTDTPEVMREAAE